MNINIFSLLFLLLSPVLFLGEISSDSMWDKSWFHAAAFVSLTLSSVFVIISKFVYLFDIRLFQLSGFTVIFYVVMLLLPSPWVYADNPNLHRDNYLVIVIISLLLTILGCILSSSLFFTLFGFKNKSEKWLNQETITMSIIDKYYVLLLLIFSIVIMIAYIRELGVLPIFQAISGQYTSLELAQSREDAFKLFESPIKRGVGYVSNLIFPLVTTVLLMKMEKSRNKKIWSFIFILSFICNIFLASITLEKSPVAILLIQLFLAWFLFKKHKLNIGLLSTIISISLSFPVFVIFTVNSFTISIYEIFVSIFVRMAYTPSKVLLAYVDYFSNNEYLWGQTLPIIAKYFLGGNVWIENIIGLTYFGSWIESIHANVGYPGYFWADFGWMGVIIGSLLAGFLLQLIQLTIYYLPKSPFTIALYIFAIRRCFYLTSASFPTSFIYILQFLLLILPSIIFRPVILPATKPATFNQIGNSGRKVNSNS
ncbi:O-antigen ligase [Nodularia spumigena CS-588/02]|uniref:O-antigen polymerase n=1 Tax=Nodularia spumigena TaxID=70799 RepID=UPI00232BBD69|nr:O-antigen polymerase [Nodularia spumigena]MDB9359759.1 O-antigen ligase [Nodularia spumigena CS-588/02]MDB9365109.1 O-antigen ligase [Nodularia spumigena CS-588/02A10]